MSLDGYSIATLDSPSRDNSPIGCKCGIQNCLPQGSLQARDFYQFCEIVIVGFYYFVLLGEFKAPGLFGDAGFNRTFDCEACEMIAAFIQTRAKKRLCFSQALLCKLLEISTGQVCSDQDLLSQEFYRVMRSRWR